MQKHVGKKRQRPTGKKRKHKLHINIQFCYGDNVLCSLYNENKCIFQDTQMHYKRGSMPSQFSSCLVCRAVQLLWFSSTLVKVNLWIPEETWRTSTNLTSYYQKTFFDICLLHNLYSITNPSGPWVKKEIFNHYFI